MQITTHTTINKKNLKKTFYLEFIFFILIHWPQVIVFREEKKKKCSKKGIFTLFAIVNCKIFDIVCYFEITTNNNIEIHNIFTSAMASKN